MNLVVILLSAIGFRMPATPAIINGLLIHMLGIGIPAAWFTRAVTGGNASRISV